jgi:putative transposase
VAKGQTRFTGFDDKIVSMYARGMSTREIQGHLQEIYGIEVSPTLISNVTEAIVEEVKAWQGRPLEEVYPIVYLDAMMVKMRDNGHVQNQAIYVVLGVDREGQKEVLGLWVALSLLLHQDVKRTFTSKLSIMLGTPKRKGRRFVCP